MGEYIEISEGKVYFKIRYVRYECKHYKDYLRTTEQSSWCDQNAKATKATKATKAMEEYLMR